MASVSAIVLTRNEERNIAACLKGLLWAQETIVVDSLSRDRTLEIARAFTDRVFQRPFTTFAHQRNAALALAQSEWVFFLDADERVTPALAMEIQAAVSNGTATEASTSRRGRREIAGYWVPRRNYILGHWVRHGGWHPDYQMRLFRRSLGRYDEARDPHEIVVLQGRTGFLAQPIVHYNYVSFGQVFTKQLAYAAREAKTLHWAGQRQKARWYLSHPLREFQRRYVQLEGYKDGFLGLFLSLVMAWYRLKVGIDLARLRKKRIAGEENVPPEEQSLPIQGPS